MGLFSKRPKQHARPLSAAGQRLNQTNRTVLHDLVRNRDQQWQSYAWGYRDAIGEVRLAIQFLAWNVAKIRIMAAEVPTSSDDPIPVPDPDGTGGINPDLTIDRALAQAAQEELERLPIDAGFDFLGVMVENLKVAGECWLHGYEDEAGQEQWRIRSVDEVVIEGGNIGVRDQPGTMARRVTSDEEMIRLWVPHSRWHNLADSPMRPLLDSCEDLVLVGREIRAAARSRIMANGILKTPNGLTIHRNTTVDSDNTAAFVAELEEALIAPISNEGDAGSVAPAVVTGDAEDLAAFTHLTLAREDSEKLLEKAEAALLRVVRGLDIPPEWIMGMSNANHWTAWQIDSAMYRQHIDPTVRIVCDSLTQGYLRPALLERGFTPQQVSRVRAWRDAGNLTENPNRGQDARDAHAAGAIGWRAFRDALGFSEDDAPGEAEFEQMLAFKSGLDARLTAQILNLTTPNTPRVIDTPQNNPTPDTDQPATPDTATPNTQPDAVTAATTPPGWTIHTEAGRELADIDRELRTRITEATDAAIERALERAGARARSKLHNTRGRDATTHLKNTPPQHLAATIGHTTITQLGLTDHDLLTGAFTTLEPKIIAWTQQATQAAITIITRILNLTTTKQHQLQQHLTNTINTNHPTAWATLTHTLTQRTQQLLHKTTPNHPTPGEQPTTHTPPTPIRTYLNTLIGGNNPTNSLTGGEIQNTLTTNGATQLAHQWRYGPTPRQNTYHPHLALNNTRYTTHTDPKLATQPPHTWIGPYFHPGDHEGCLCDFMPIWATNDADQQVRDRLMGESEVVRGSRLLAELDDVEGRVGTSAQAGRDRRVEVLELQRAFIEG